MYFTSAYFQFQDAIEPYLDELGTILRRLAGRNVLIGVDANARSTLWHDEIVDARGELLEEFIERFGLVVVNEADQPSTHSAGNNIDLTLATPGLARRISELTVHEVTSSSDHRLITLKIEVSGLAPVFDRIPRFNISKMDPERF